MARLINESGVLGESIKISANEVNSVSFDTIIDAIETVQSRMGITGTTFNEAEITVSGSIDAMKASWRNLKVALASNGDIEKSLNEFGGSVKNAWSNVAPVIGNTLQSMWSIADQYISDSKFGDYWEDLKEKIQNCIDVSKDFFERLEKDETTEQEELALAALAGVFTAVAAALGLTTAATIAQTVATKGAALAQAALNAVMNLNPFVLIVSLIAGVVAALVVLWNTNEGFRNFCKDAWEDIKNFGVNAWNGIKEGWSDAKDWGKNLIDNIKNGIAEKWDSLKNWFKDKISGLFDFGSSNGGSGEGWLRNLFNGSHADGLSYVPFDGYVAELHKGERVLTAKEAKAYNNGQSGGNNISIVINGANYSDERTLADAVSRALQNALDRRNAAYA